MSRFSRKLAFLGGAGLVVAQISLSLVVLVVMSALAGTLINLKGVEAGFSAEGVSTMEVELLEPAAAGDDQSRRWKAMLYRLEGLPDVQAVSLSWMMPLSGAP